MRHRIGATSVMGLVLFLVLAGMFGCDRRPTKPTEPIKYYAFSFKGGGGANILKYDFETRELDSAFVPINLGTITPSADGTTLYSAGRYEHGADILDTRTWEVIGQLPVIGDVVASPDGRYLAVHWDDFYILDAKDYQVIIHDTLPVGRGVFNRSSTLYYATTRQDTCRELYTLRLRPPYSVERTCIANLTVSHGPLLSPDETKLYFYTDYGTFISALVEYDLLLQSVTFKEYLVPGGGHFDMHPEGWVGFTNTPNSPALVGPPPPYAWAAYHIDNRTIDSTIILYSPCDSFNLPLQELAFTQDGEFMIGMLQDGGRIFVLDLSADSITQTFCLGNNSFTLGLTVNNGINNGGM